MINMQINMNKKLKHLQHRFSNSFSESLTSAQSNDHLEKKVQIFPDPGWDNWLSSQLTYESRPSPTTPPFPAPPPPAASPPMPHPG